MKESQNITLNYLTDGIARITMNDPSNYNALSSKNISSLIGILKKRTKILFQKIKFH